MPLRTATLTFSNGGRYGSGRYSVITTKEANEETHFERMGKLPQIAGLVSINRLLLPERLESDREIRTAASWVRRDSADEARRQTEQGAFRKLIDEFIATWPTVLSRHRAGG